MYDTVLVLGILTQIFQAAITIEKRFEPVNSVNDFTDSPGGMEKSFCLSSEMIEIVFSFKPLYFNLNP